MPPTEPKVYVACLVALTACGCRQPSEDTPAPGVAAASGYLEAAVRDYLGEQHPVLALAEPGLCPGHFDLRPSQVESLRGCRVLVRFDFQAGLDQKLGELAKSGLRIVPVALQGGLCEPATYLEACRQVAAALVATGVLKPAVADGKQVAIADRMSRLTLWAQQQIAEKKLNGRPVIASRHQAAFCRFLGLDVVATFTGADTTSVGEINQVLEGGTAAKIVVANLPEGRGLADALAERLGAQVVVLGNFPDQAHHHDRFDELVRENVQLLTAAAPP